MNRATLAALLVLVPGSSSLFADEATNSSNVGASATASHVTIQLIPEKNAVTTSQPFDVVVHLRVDTGWLVAWLHPGRAGSPVSITWKLPPGFTAGPIQWPPPAEGDLGCFGYSVEADLVTTITPPPQIGNGAKADTLTADVSWTVGDGKQSLPESQSLSVPIQVGHDAKDTIAASQKDLVQKAKAELPSPNTIWDVKASYEKDPDWPTATHGVLRLLLKAKPGVAIQIPEAYMAVYIEEAGFDFDNQVSHQMQDSDPAHYGPGDLLSSTPLTTDDRPKHVAFLIESGDRPFAGQSRSIYFLDIPVEDKMGP